MGLIVSALAALAGGGGRVVSGQSAERYRPDTYKTPPVNYPEQGTHCLARIGNAQPGWRKERSRARHREMMRRRRRNAGRE